MWTDPNSRVRHLRRVACRWLLACSLGLAAAPMAATVPTERPEPDPRRVLHVEIPAAETTLDPQVLQDLYSGEIASTLFEGLLSYDYLARPARIVPLLAESLPEVSDAGRTLLFRLRRDVLFADDPAFGGQVRSVRASDVVFTLTRLMDPVLHSPYTFLLEGKVVGLDALAKAAAAAHRAIDYQASIPGLEAVDEHTVRIRLNAPDPDFLHGLAQPNLGIVAPEVVRRYGSAVGEHPVGTGPYVLSRWVHASAITLDANPRYRVRTWDFDPGDDLDARRVAAQMRGKRIPALPRVEIKVIEEPQSAWLAFQRQELDLLFMNPKLAPVVLRDGQLTPELKARGYQLSKTVRPEITFNYLNIRDPVVGGMDAAHIALRRAILMAQDDQEFIRVIRKGEAIHSPYVIPPGVIGHDPHYRGLLEFDPDGANVLLEAFGYLRGSDGFRRQPDGAPLVIHYWRQHEGDTRDFEELFKRDLERIHIRSEGRTVPFPDLLKAERDCQVTIRLGAWIADYPDGDDFMQLFYGPNIGANNLSCFKNDEWDALYRRSHAMEAGPERDALYHRMARMLEVYGIAKVSHTRIFNMVMQPRVLGFRKTQVEAIAEWPFLDLQ
jgi:ABC-type transport system substrate-binding protein